MFYCENPPRPELRDRIACIWAGTASGHATGVLPDGCVDIVWAPGLEPFVAGPDTTARPSGFVPGTMLAGIRFLPGAARPILGAPISSLLDKCVPLGDLWPRRPVRDLRARLDEARDSAQALRTIEDAVLARRADAPEPDEIVRAVIACILRSVADGRPADIPCIGVSARQLRRRFVAAVGYGPKMFQRVARFQHFIKLGTAVHGFAALAAEAGYADQSHLNRECISLAGCTPCELVAL
ncbi:MAG: DUF6597 domain-containing transcriptional factor [Candidatus Binataceae bacterium]